MMDSKGDSLYEIWQELIREEAEELEREQKKKEKEGMGNSESQLAPLTKELVNEVEERKKMFHEECMQMSIEELENEIDEKKQQLEVLKEPEIEMDVGKKRTVERKLRSHLNFMIDCGGLPLKLDHKVDPEIFEEFWSLQNDHHIKFGITTDYGHCSRIGKWVRLNEQYLFSGDGRHIVYYYHRH